MNTISSLLKFLGNTLGANPKTTLTTTSKTLVGAINEVRNRTVDAFIIEDVSTTNGYDFSAYQFRTITRAFTAKSGYRPITIKAYSDYYSLDIVSFYIASGENRVTMNVVNRTGTTTSGANFYVTILWVKNALL